MPGQGAAHGIERDARIEGHKASFMRHGQGQQVQVGQLAVVTLLPLAYLLRRRTGNRPAWMRVGSSAIASLALPRLIKRPFDFSVMPIH